MAPCAGWTTGGETVNWFLVSRWRCVGCLWVCFCRGRRETRGHVLWCRPPPCLSVLSSADGPRPASSTGPRRRPLRQRTRILVAPRIPHSDPAPPPRTLPPSPDTALANVADDVRRLSAAVSNGTVFVVPTARFALICSSSHVFSARGAEGRASAKPPPTGHGRGHSVPDCPHRRMPGVVVGLARRRRRGPLRPVLRLGGRFERVSWFLKRPPSFGWRPLPRRATSPCYVYRVHHPRPTRGHSAPPRQPAAPPLPPTRGVATGAVMRRANRVRGAQPRRGGGAD